MKHTNLSYAFIAGLVASNIVTSVLSMHYEKENHRLDTEIAAYQSQVSELESSVDKLTDDLQNANSSLKDTTDTLSRFTNPIEYVTAAAPHYSTLPIGKDIQEYTYSMCSYYGIEQYYEIVLAVMWQESHFNPDTVSSTDDYGIMQINKCNHDFLYEALGLTDILDVKDNIHAGVYILSTQFNKYDSSDKALMAYNMGPSGAAALWDRGIYTSNYSRSVLDKAALIEENNYN